MRVRRVLIKHRNLSLASQAEESNAHDVSSWWPSARYQQDNGRRSGGFAEQEPIYWHWNAADWRNGESCDRRWTNSCRGCADEVRAVRSHIRQPIPSKRVLIYAFLATMKVGRKDILANGEQTDCVWWCERWLRALVWSWNFNAINERVNAVGWKGLHTNSVSYPETST